MDSVRLPQALSPGTAACIGAFDGLHRGHQALLTRAATLAPRIALVTFDPHPAQVLAPDRAPPLLQSAAQRERTCRALGVDALALLPFTRETASTPPEVFVAEALLNGLAPAAVVVGEDFRFGAQRAGDPALLETLLSPRGIPVVTVAAVPGASGAKIGSTAIRAALSEGQVARAAEALGRWYAVGGRVEYGHARGRDLGFPTANVAAESLVPHPGVYAGYLRVLDADWPGTATFEAVANIGTNPTFDDGTPPVTTVEAHAIGTDLGDRLYDRRVEFAFVSRLRDEVAFDGPEALKRAIADDIATAREHLTADARTRCDPAPIPRPSSAVNEATS